MRVDCEVRTATGRVDAVVATRESLYVVELKYGGTAEEAVAQIDSRGYLLPFAGRAEAAGLRLAKVGAAYDPGERTIAEGWIIEWQ